MYNFNSIIISGGPGGLIVSATFRLTEVVRLQSEEHYTSPCGRL